MPSPVSVLTATSTKAAYSWPEFGGNFRAIATLMPRGWIDDSDERLEECSAEF